MKLFNHQIILDNNYYYSVKELYNKSYYTSRVN